MNLDVRALYIAIAESRLATKEILQRAGITPRTWQKARTEKSIRAQTAGRIAYALNVPITTLLPTEP